MKLIYFLLCLVVLMGLNDTLGAQSKEELVSVHGQATDLLGHPLERVSLKFYARSWYMSSPDARLIITSITDHQGKYEARDLPYGCYAIVAAAQGFQTTEVSREELGSLSARVVHRIFPVIEALARQPRPKGCRKLTTEKILWRIRVGDYRVIYAIDYDKLAIDMFALRINARPRTPDVRWHPSGDRSMLLSAHADTV